MKLKTNHEAHSSDKTSKEIVREIIIANLLHTKKVKKKDSSKISRNENANFHGFFIFHDFFYFSRIFFFHNFFSFLTFRSFSIVFVKSETFVKVCFHIILMDL